MVHVEIEDDIEPELEKLLHTPPLQGLSDSEAAERMEKFGRNGKVMEKQNSFLRHSPIRPDILEMPEQKTNKLLKFLGYFTGTIAFLLEIAMVLSFAFEHYADGIILIVVLIANAVIGYHEEAKAENALDALKNTLALKSRVWRNSELVEIDSNLLVPGDVIVVRLGDIIPADAR